MDKRKITPELVLIVSKLIPIPQKWQIMTNEREMRKTNSLLVP